MLLLEKPEANIMLLTKQIYQEDHTSSKLSTEMQLSEKSLTDLKETQIILVQPKLLCLLNPDKKIVIFHLLKRKMIQILLSEKKEVITKLQTVPISPATKSF